MQGCTVSVLRSTTTTTTTTTTTSKPASGAIKMHWIKIAVSKKKKFLLLRQIYGHNMFQIIRANPIGF